MIAKTGRGISSLLFENLIRSLGTNGALDSRCIGALWGVLSYSIVAANQLNIIKLPYVEPQILVGLPVLPGILGSIIMLILFQQRIELHNESL